MKQEESKILSKLGKDAGFKTSDNYFSDFSKNLADKLPEVTIQETKQAPNLWVRIRPFVYMAAMCAGIFCMIQLFDVLNGTSGKSSIADGKVDGTEIVSGVGSDTDTIYNYRDSVESNSTNMEVSNHPN